jgi:hypothetical protein
MVFGRAELVRDGEVVVLKDAEEKYPAQIMNHISPFTSLEALDRNSWAAGKWAFPAITNQQGYFTQNQDLPEGRR